MFKGCKIRLEEDYKAEVCAIRKKLVKYMWEARRRGKHAVLVRDKFQIPGVLFDLQSCRKNFKTGAENIKVRERERTMATQDGKYDVENIRKVKENLSGEKNIEVKKTGDKKKETKETKEQRDKATKDFEKRTGQRRENQEEQQARREGKETGGWWWI